MSNWLESTIINLLNKPTILRFGGLDISKINKILKKKVLVKTNQKKNCSWSISLTLLSRHSIKNKCN